MRKDWTALFTPIRWMSPQANKALTLLQCSASPRAERLVPAWASWDLGLVGHGLLTPWPLNYDRIGWKLSCLEECWFLSQRRGFTHQENKGASSGCSAKIGEKYLVFSTGHFNKIFITGILNSIWRSWLPPWTPLRPPLPKSQAFYLEVHLLDFSCCSSSSYHHQWKQHGESHQH